MYDRYVYAVCSVCAWPDSAPTDRQSISLASRAKVCCDSARSAAQLLPPYKLTKLCYAQSIVRKFVHCIAVPSIGYTISTRQFSGHTLRASYTDLCAGCRFSVLFVTFPWNSSFVEIVPHLLQHVLFPESSVSSSFSCKLCSSSVKIRVHSETIKPSSGHCGTFSVPLHNYSEKQ